MASWDPPWILLKKGEWMDYMYW